MKKMFSKKVILSFALVLALCIGMLPLMAFTASAENKTDEEIIQSSQCATDREGLYFSSNNATHFSSSDNIQLSIVVKTEENIIQFSTEEKGLEVDYISQNENDNKIIDMTLSCASNMEMCSVDLEVYLSNNNVLNITIYAFNSPNGVFVSTVSFDYCTNMFLTFLVENGSLTQESMNQILNSKYCDSMINETVIVTDDITELAVDDNVVDLFASSAGSGDTAYVLTLKWQDDNGNLHPARNLTVKVYDHEAVGNDELLATLVTNSSGTIYFYFDNPDRLIDLENGGYDIYVRITVGDGNVTVGNYNISTLDNSSYYLENVSTGVTHSQTFTFQKETEMAKAVQVLQAATTARDFSKTMMGSTPPEIGILYPVQETDTVTTSYNKTSSGDFIFLCESTNSSGLSAYESWDVIMHEYGHHIEDHLDITDGYGGAHTITGNIAVSRKDKFVGISLAWSEGWATVFGMVAQNYYLSSLSNIANIGNGIFEASHINGSISYETPSAKIGEACELSVGAVLWDLYDAANESHDVISLSASRWWTITTQAGNKDFSVFSDRYISSYYPGIANRLNYGKLLSYHGMAPSFRTSSCHNGNLSGTTPYIIWNPGGNGSFVDENGDSYNLVNDIFKIEVYDDSYNLIFTKEFTNSTVRSYTFTAAEWQGIRANCDTTYTICIKGTDSSDFYTTYYSEGLTYSIP